jgi:predicted phage terminase large subunit-like protein
MKSLTSLERQAVLEIQRNSLPEFIRRSFSIVGGTAQYKHNWHIDYMCEVLNACEKRQLTRVIINMPPRHLKSHCVTVAWPPWLLGRNPGETIMCASYSKELALDLSVKSRHVITSDWYNALFPGTILADDQNTKTKFKTTEGGHRYAVSVGGTATGDGGNFIIIDDPVSAKDANSKIIRDTANEWFGQTAHNRLNDKINGVIIVIMQRLHQNDMTGFLLEQPGWEHIKLPVQFEEKKTYIMGNFSKTVEENEILHPEHMGQVEIDREKHVARNYNFSGQFMQNPAPTGGGEFRQQWLQFYKGKLQPTTMNIYIMVDPANSKRKTSDYSAFVVLGLGSDDNIYLLDMVRDKLNLRERQEELFRLHQKYKPKAVLYEKYGMMVDADAMRESMNYLNYRFNIVEVAGAMNKEDRVRRLIPYFIDGRIWFPENMYRTNWEGKTIDLIEEFIHQELLPFPVGLHDDCVDAMSRIFDTQLIWPAQNNFDYYQFAEGFK